MSTRRNFILAATAGVTASGATYAVTAGAPQPDPILALLEAEERAWKAFRAATTRLSKAEQAWLKSEWSRKPRVQVAIAVDLAEGPEFNPVSADEFVERPVYVHSREAIDENCARYSRLRAGAAPEMVEARRARMHAEFEADEAAIANAPETILYEQAEAEHYRLSTTHLEICRSIMDVRPTTIPGLLVMLDRVRDRGDGFSDDTDETLGYVAASVRALLDGRAA